MIKSKLENSILLPIEMTTPCPQCGENRWSNHGTTEIPIIPHELIDRQNKGEKIYWEKYDFERIKTVGFTCKSCGYTIMKDENGNMKKWDYTDIEK